MTDVARRMQATIEERSLAAPDDALLLMVSGGSDSTALAYAACDLSRSGAVGPVRMLHVNHRLRGADADADERFVCELARVLDVPLVVRSIDVAEIARAEGGNIEAVARRERYRAAHDALRSWLAETGLRGRIAVAHTQDDRVETFYMRSIVGTGPGGFRAMRYENGLVIRPLLDASREDLRRFARTRAAAGLPVARDAAGALWREDATNAHTDLFRAYVRHEIVPLAQARNPKLLDTLCRTMNLIADEDDMLEEAVGDILAADARWLDPAGSPEEAGFGSERAPGRADAPEGLDPAGVPAPADAAFASASDRPFACRLSPGFCLRRAPLRRRAIARVLSRMLGPDSRIESASVEAIMAACGDTGPRSGYVANIQGDLAVSANKRGILVEPMAAFRARRKRSR